MNTKKGVILKLSILSVTMLCLTHNSVSGVLPSLVNQFPNVDITTIQSFVTMPEITNMILLLLSGVLVSLLGSRRVLFIGIAFYTICGRSSIISK